MLHAPGSRQLQAVQHVVQFLDQFVVLDLHFDRQRTTAPAMLVKST